MDSAAVLIDRDAFIAFWVTWVALVVFAWHEWSAVLAPPPTAKSCDKHPGTDYCRCRGNLPPGKR